MERSSILDLAPHFEKPILAEVFYFIMDKITDKTPPIRNTINVKIKSVLLLSRFSNLLNP